MQEEAPQPIPISQARSKREASPKIETTVDEMRQIVDEALDRKLLAKIEVRQFQQAVIEAAKIEVQQIQQAVTEAIEQGVAEKITRLEVSINRMMDHIEAVTSGTAENAALRVTTDHSAADLAIAKINLKPEDYYVHTTGELADKLNIRPYDVTKMVRVLALKGDNQYHKAIKTGKTTEVQKYSEATLVRLKEALDSGEYPRPTISAEM